MTVRIYQNNSHTMDERDGIGGNSVSTVGKTIFVTRSGEFVVAATAGSRIAGVSVTQSAFASDNQTVAKARLSYFPAKTGQTYEVTITGGTITVVDEGKYYNLSDSETVDGTTETTTPYYVDPTALANTPVVSMQLKLVKFVSATSSIFEIVSLG